MLRHRKWIAVIACTLALLFVLVASPGLAHAANTTNHAPLHSFSPAGVEGPPGCTVFVQLASSGPHNLSYAGHSFTLSTALWAWYYRFNDPSLGFCDAILCNVQISATSPQTFPAGTLETYCGLGSGDTTRWTGGGTLDLIDTGQVTASAGQEWDSVGKFTPAGRSGPFIVVSNRINIPGTIA